MAGSKDKTSSDPTTGKGNKVYVTIHHIHTDEQLTFEDGDTVGHMIDAVAASDNLELRIAGTDARKLKDKKLGDIAKEGKVEANVGSRRGSNG